MYNFRQRKYCNVFETNFNDVLDGNLEDGLYHIKDDQYFDILIKNFSADKIIKGKVLVCFSGAVADRKNKDAPFFSGEKIADELGLPLISLADPSVSGSELNLAWYAGSNKNKIFQRKVLIFLKSIISNYKAELILFGGSGGGFAALLFAQAIQLPVKCLVWNPQIKIENYNSIFVDKFINIAFDNNLNFSNSPERSEFLKTQGIINDISVLKSNSGLSLVYLQNTNDFFHVKNHLQHFKNKYKWCQINEVTLNSGGLLIQYGDWGEGHAVPNKDFLKKMLIKFVDAKSVLECVDLNV